MSDFAIIRHKKIKNSEAFNGMKAHNERTIFASNVATELSCNNVVLVKNPYSCFDDFVEKKRKYIYDKNVKNDTKHRMIRKVLNKVNKKREYKAMVQEFIFTHSPNVMSAQDSVDYCKLALDFIREYYPELEVISAIIHMDESTPHIHIQVAYFDMNVGRFCQSDLQDEGRTDIDNIRDAWEKKRLDVGFVGLRRQDGSVISKQEHDGSKADFDKKLMKQQIAKLEKVAFVDGLEVGDDDGDVYPVRVPIKDALERVEKELAVANERIRELEQPSEPSDSPALALNL